ncbi:hypothetical protein GCM10018781_24250 [Kitasatospora indigofera]|uniref:Uncharacterized protein n=1 Tax=Kitasatospora indigofera TaxID=67307 RepID=A0A919FKW3_9ACTN|nr:hypothetical protein GCM10018781_24250 [Kitasatospora indigofera]
MPAPQLPTAGAPEGGGGATGGAGGATGGATAGATGGAAGGTTGGAAGGGGGASGRSQDAQRCAPCAEAAPHDAQMAIAASPVVASPR